VTSEATSIPRILAELRTRKHEEFWRVLYQSPARRLPNLAVGGVPISPSVASSR
jgi:hypothetical protein